MKKNYVLIALLIFPFLTCSTSLFGQIEIIKPDKYSVLLLGKDADIIWTFKDTSNKGVKIELLNLFMTGERINDTTWVKKDSIIFCQLINKRVIGNKYRWKVNVEPQDNYVIKITSKSDTSINTYSDRFKIEDDEVGKFAYLNLGGDLQNVTSISSNTKSSTAVNATIGFKLIQKKRSTQRIFKNKIFNQWEASLYISVAASGDTIENDYGASILITKKGVPSATLEFRYNELLYSIFGKGGEFTHFDLIAYLSASSSIWKIDTIPNYIRATNFSGGIFPLGTDLARFFDLKDKSNTDVTCSIAAGWCFRWLVGDLIFPENDNLRNKLLGTTKTFFHGIELKAAIGYQGLLVNASFIYIGGYAKGISRGNLLTSFNVGTNIRL